MKISKIHPFSGNSLNVIIETPKGSQHKYDYDPDLKLFRLKKSLPMGTVFPFDFGFIPNTKGEDGDPLDALVIADETCCQGCLVECRLLGVLRAKQKEKGSSKMVRNDRFIAVAKSSVVYAGITGLKELNKNMVEEIKNFFVDYNRHEGKAFIPFNWHGAKQAVRIIKNAAIPS